MKYLAYILIALTISCTQTEMFAQSGWYPLNSGVSIDLTDVFFTDPNTGYVGTDSKLLKTTNGGNNWTIINLLAGNWVNSIYFNNSQTGYLGGDAGRLFKTTNGGSTIDVILPGTSHALHSVFFPTIDTGYIATKYGLILKSVNAGLNWAVLNSPVIFSLEGLYCVNSQLIFASGGYTNWNIIRSVNGGLAWDSIKLDSAHIIQSLFFLNSQTGFCCGYSGKGRIYKTTNSGMNWVMQYVTQNQTYLSSIYFVNINTGYCVGTSANNFIWKTTDSGNTWGTYSTNVGGGFYAVYFANTNTGYAVGTNGGIYKTTDGGGPIGITPISTEIPKQYSLSQNYPNPFNPTTKIKFSIPSPLSNEVGEGLGVRLTIFDILGREVITLVDEELKPGTYEVNFDGTNYPSGVYYYKLTTDDFTETRKMVLMK